MALPLKKTLGELRAELITRLGFGAQGSAAGAIIGIADSFIQNAQSDIYEEYDLKELIKAYDYTTGVGQTLYDFRNDMNHLRIRSVQVQYNDFWIPLEEGIEYYHDTNVDRQFYPRRYDIRSQLEIWPEPDAAYTLRVEYIQNLEQFTMDNNRATIDDRLIFNRALWNAKDHYGQEDAKNYLDAYNKRLSRLKYHNHTNKRYVVGKKPAEALPKPVVIDYL